MSNYSATTNAYMDLATTRANNAYKSAYLESNGAYNPTSSTSFTGGNQSIFTGNATNQITDVNLTQATGAEGTENACTDGADDGKIGFGEKAGSFIKGVFSPITNMFKSPGDFIKGAAMIAGGAILCAATGGAAAPLLVAAGVGMGGYQAVKGAVNASKATTDAEAKAAWEDIGCGTGMVAASVVGAKAAAKGAASAGVEGFEGAESMNALQATKACITNAGKAGSASLKAFTSGAWKTNLGLAGKGSSSAPKEATPVKEEVNTTVKETKTATAEPKVTEPKVESKVDINNNTADTNAPKLNSGAQEQPKLESGTENVSSQQPNNTNPAQNTQTPEELAQPYVDRMNNAARNGDLEFAKKVYRDGAKDFHPDLNKGQISEETMKIINLAYENLQKTYA